MTTHKYDMSVAELKEIFDAGARYAAQEVKLETDLSQFTDTMQDILNKDIEWSSERYHCWDDLYEEFYEEILGK